MSTGSDTASASPAPGVVGARLDVVLGACAAISGSARASPAGALRNTGAGGRASRTPGAGRAGACLGRHWPARAAPCRRVHRRAAASRSGTPTMTASSKALASHQSGSGTGGGAFAAASAARCAASCACTSCCMRSTIAVSSTMRWRRMTVSASIEFASSCCARSRSASVRRARRRGRVAAGHRARHRESRPVGGHGRRALRRGLCRGARLGRGRLARRARAISGARGCRATLRNARRSSRCARGTRARGGCGAATASRGADSAATTGASIAGGSMNNVYSRCIEVSQPACTVTLTTGSCTGRGLVMTSCAPARRALDGDAAEQDLRDTVRVALCRRQLEAFRRNVLPGGERHGNDDPQRACQAPTAA